ncbi:MAG: DUF4143 domain-containing protein [Bacteroidales bacterium]|nr:DUF4143 domain-containing protein [Bacteroidales bacterium]MDY0370332.1 DUF4143 domain-containing protein [Bacteroidales bacterium]
MLDSIVRKSPPLLLHPFSTFVQTGGYGELIQVNTGRQMGNFNDAFVLMKLLLHYKMSHLIKKSQVNDGDVFHYRDKSGLESDMIVRLRDGRWAAIEVKLGHSQVDVAANNLLALQAKINEKKMGQASFLMVITGGEYAYSRPDGVLVVPIGCLRD